MLDVITGYFLVFGFMVSTYCLKITVPCSKYYKVKCKYCAVTAYQVICCDLEGCSFSISYILFDCLHKCTSSKTSIFAQLMIFNFPHSQQEFQLRHWGQYLPNKVHLLVIVCRKSFLRLVITNKARVTIKEVHWLVTNHPTRYSIAWYHTTQVKLNYYLDEKIYMLSAF